jgi:hypothetical protein
MNNDQIAISNIALEELFKRNAITKGEYSMFYNTEVTTDTDVYDLMCDIMSENTFINQVKEYINNSVSDNSFSQLWVKYMMEYTTKHNMNTEDHYFDAAYFLDNKLNQFEDQMFNYIIDKINSDDSCTTNSSYTFDELMDINQIEFF